MHHRGVSHPRQPHGYVSRQVTSKQLRCKRIQGAYRDAHLHVHAAGADEEPNTLRHHGV